MSSRLRWGLRWRILLPITALVLGALVSFGLYEDTSARKQAAVMVNQRGGAVLTRLTERIEERERAKTVYVQLLSQIEGIPTLLERKDVNGILQILVPLRSRLGLGHVVLFDKNAECMLLVGEESDDIHSQSITQVSLNGLTRSHIDVTGSGLVISAESPVRGQGGIVGAILVGTIFDEARLAEFITEPGLGIALYRGGELQMLAGLPEEHAGALANAFAQSKAAESFAILLGNHSYQALRRNVNQGDAILALVPTSDLVAAQEQRQRTLIFVITSLGALLVLTCFILARDIARPLESMVAATRGIIDGDFQHIVAPSNIGELNELGNAINHQSTRIREQIQALSHQAFRDSLTGLPNRASFMLALSKALTRPPNHPSQIALVFLDLDNFKYVNDSLGHDAGDALLAIVADRLRTCVRGSDIVARFGGDEFTLLLEGSNFPHDAMVISDRINQALREPVTLGNQDVYVTASLGIAMSSGGAHSPEELLRQADIAMFRAKASGKANFEVFEHGMNSSVAERMQLAVDLRRALEREEIFLHYQPIVDLQTGALLQIEALLRWEHPSRGTISPATFIPIAEETGLILEIGQFVIEEACRQAKRWHDASPDGAAPSISINLSARQFQQQSLVDDVATVLRETGLDPKYVILEITESIMMHDRDVSMRSLRELKKLGVRIAVDDFGTGYSSLAYLRWFPVDTLKIDRAFISGIDDNEDDRAIVESIIALARSLDLSVTGEGIETEQQASWLRSLGCYRGQGYYFSRPVASTAIDALLRPVREAALGA